MESIKKVTVRRNEKHSPLNFLTKNQITDEKLFEIMFKAFWALEALLSLTKGNGNLNPERNSQLKQQLNEGLIFAIGCYEFPSIYSYQKEDNSLRNSKPYLCTHMFLESNALSSKASSSLSWLAVSVKLSEWSRTKQAGCIEDTL